MRNKTETKKYGDKIIIAHHLTCRFASFIAHTKNLETIIKPYHLPDGEENRVGDNGDFYVVNGKGRPVRCEIKGLSRTFHDAKSWMENFGDREIVCKVSSWDNVTPKPEVFFYISACEKAYAVYKPINPDTWWIEEITDPEGVTQVYYFTKLSESETVFHREDINAW